MISSRESLILIVHICVHDYCTVKCGGVTSWYQSRLPVGIPLSNSLAEVESSHWKTFTNMAVWLTGPRRHWVVLGSFIPRLYSGTLISLLFGLNDFLKSNFRFSKTLSPGEPLQSRWSPTAPEDFGDTLWYSLETLCPSLLLFPTTDKSLWITTYTCHSYDHPPLILLLQDTPSTLRCSKNPLCLLLCSFFSHCG